MVFVQAGPPDALRLYAYSLALLMIAVTRKDERTPRTKNRSSA